MRVGQRVIMIDTGAKGRVVGTCCEFLPDDNLNLGFIVSLDEGFYDPSGKTYISRAIVHESNMKEDES